MNNYAKLTSGLIVAWFTFSLLASALSLFQNNVNGFGITIAFAALIPLLIFAVWFAGSRKFRQFALSVDPSVLTAAQTWRILGFVFLLLQARTLLPAMFALPAGYGDMAIGITATAVAWKLANPAHRGTFIAWQLFGIADLVTAVALGTTASLIHPSGVTMYPMTVLPLSLIPTFLVPLFLMLHVISIAQALKWKSVPAGVLRTALAR